MRIVNTLAAAAAALTIAVSLAGCQLVNEAVDQARQQEQSQNQAGTAPEGAAPAEGHVVNVLRVVDGDTIAVSPDETLPATNDAGTEHVIRLLGIDAPEMNKMSEDPAECGAQEALDHLVALLSSSSNVSIVFDSRADQTDRYGRSLAYVNAQGADVALSMIAGGYVAAWYPQGEPEPERFASYSGAQQTAESADAGSFASCDTIGR